MTAVLPSPSSPYDAIHLGCPSGQIFGLDDLPAALDKRLHRALAAIRHRHLDVDGVGPDPLEPVSISLATSREVRFSLKESGAITIFIGHFFSRRLGCQRLIGARIRGRLHCVAQPLKVAFFSGVAGKPLSPWLRIAQKSFAAECRARAFARPLLAEILNGVGLDDVNPRLGPLGAHQHRLCHRFRVHCPILAQRTRISGPTTASTRLPTRSASRNSSRPPASSEGRRI